MLWTLLLVATLAQGVASSVSHPPDIEPPTAWADAGVPFETVESVRFLPVAEVNLETTRAWTVGLEWPTRALDVALRAVEPPDAARIHIRTQSRGEDRDTVWISFVQLGFLDDSVRGRRDDLELVKQLDGTYRVRAHERSHACWRGPVPNTWTARPCP